MNALQHLRVFILAVSTVILTTFSASIMAKSAFVLANINSGGPSPVHSYSIGAAPDVLTFQAEDTVPNLAGGAVGIGIDDASKKLFVTYEGSGTIQLLDALTFDDLGTTTAPGASNLAGILVDQSKSRVYVVDRTTARLYVYDWVSSTNTLNLVDGGGASGEFALASGTSAFGLALDEINALLYVADGASNLIRVYETTNFTELTSNSFGLAHNSIDIALDQTRQLLYSGAVFNGSVRLIRYDITNDTVISVDIGDNVAPNTSEGVIGVAVDETTGNVFITTGFTDDRLMVFDSDLNILQNLTKTELQAQSGGTDWGDPTGIVIPRSEITFGAGTLFVGTGKGSSGPFELLIAMLALPLLLARRGLRWTRIVKFGSGLGMLLALVLTSNAVAGGWYAGAGIGRANTDASAGDYDADLAGKGYTTVSSLSDSNVGRKLFVGYEFTMITSLEVAYVNLGDVTSSTTVNAGPPGFTSDDFAIAAASVHPYSVDGVSVSGKFTRAINDKFSVFAKLGLFIWKADINVECASCTTAASAPDDESGVNLTGGLGVGYQFTDQVGMRLEWERFDTDRDYVDLFSISGLYKF